MARPRSDVQAVRCRLLKAAEELLRQHGAAKVTVGDIAEHCGMSHSNVYRFFPNKAAIVEALADAWFVDGERRLERIAATRASASERIEAFVVELLLFKRQKVIEDRQLFLAYLTLEAGCRAVILRHVERLHAILLRIVRDGAATEFTVDDPEEATRLLELATFRFRHPRMIFEYIDEPAVEQARALVRLLLNGLRRPPTPAATACENSAA